MNDKETGVGSIISTIIIIALIVLGSLYFWGKRMQIKQEARANIENSTEHSPNEAETAAVLEGARIRTVTPSIDLDSIQADLDNTNTSVVTDGL